MHHIPVIVEPVGEKNLPCNLLTWKRTSGDLIRAGDTLAELEDDKATFEIAADLPPETHGTLEILVAAGTTVVPGAHIARIAVDAPTYARWSDQHR